MMPGLAHEGNRLSICHFDGCRRSRSSRARRDSSSASCWSRWARRDSTETALLVTIPSCSPWFAGTSRPSGVIRSAGAACCACAVLSATAGVDAFLDHGACQVLGVQARYASQRHVDAASDLGARTALVVVLYGNPQGPRRARAMGIGEDETASQPAGSATGVYAFCVVLGGSRGCGGELESVSAWPWQLPGGTTPTAGTVADERRRVRFCAGGCGHAWHHLGPGADIERPPRGHRGSCGLLEAVRWPRATA